MKKIILIIVLVCLVVLGIFVYLSFINNDSFKEYESTNNEDNSESEVREDGDDVTVSDMRIRVSNGDKVIIYELNDSKASSSLYNQLPLTLEVEDYSTNEKIFYPSELDVSDAPLAEGGSGVLAYYAPWGDVVMFYGNFSANSSLYELGHVIEGEDNIKDLSGEIVIEKLEN